MVLYIQQYTFDLKSIDIVNISHRYLTLMDEEIGLRILVSALS